MTALGLLAPRRYRALPAQYGMIVNTLRHPGHGVDLVQATLDWTEPIEPQQFEAAWQGAMRRNPVLRTAFAPDGEDGFVQVVDPDARLDVRWSAESYADFLLADRRAEFDLFRAPLIRLTVLGRHRSVLTFHHALLDGHSLRLLLEEVTAAYAGGVEPPERPPFHEFVRWWYEADSAAAQRFWAEYLGDSVLPQPLPGYLGEPSGLAEPRVADRALSIVDSERVGAAARMLGLRSSTMVTAAWALLRARYGGVEDVVVAVTRSCRHGSIPGADVVLGPMINTVPLRVRCAPQWTVRELLAAVDGGVGEIRRHQRSPMASILSWAGLGADTPVLDSLVMFDRRRPGTGLTGPLSVRLDRLPAYPLSVYAYDEPALRLGLLWDGTRFACGAPERILDQLCATVIALAGSPSTTLAELDLGAAAGIPAAWNDTAGSYPRDSTVAARFAAAVHRDPDAEAVAFGTGSWSYRELDRRSNALAWALRRRGVRTDTPVAVIMPRGAELIVVLLAVLKAGGAYLHLDPGTPPARRAAVLGGVELTVTADDLAGLSTVDEPPPDLAHPLSLAYLSVTSGSTGTPKTVAVPHRAVLRLVSNQTFAPLGPGERVLQLAPVAFDASTLEIWGALLTGATLVIAPPGPLGLPEVAALLRTAGVTVAWLTSGVFHQLAEHDPGALAAVPWILAGGDVLNPGAVRAALAARDGRPLVNGYGPTENTTFTACHLMTDPGQVGRTVPIGRPIRHTTVHILDPRLRPVPVGVIGELCTGGDGLARGYAANASATARAFVPDPGGVGKRLYRTGDLARWRADGTLELIGRADDQVKLRGFRVEPGEVEAVLRTHPGVRDAVVVVRGDGDRRHLAGYVTGAVEPARLREFVAGRLPDYLVPDTFLILDHFPLGANGKVDRAALPEAEPELGGGMPSTPPRTATERRLAGIWRTLLPTGRVIGREDSFFALGGNSLTAARLMFHIRKEFGADLPLGSFYDAPTLAAGAAAVDAAGPNLSGTIRRSDRRAYRVSPATHLVPLTGDWALWRAVTVRAAGFPVDLLDPLGDPRLAELADAGDRPAYAAEFPAAVRRLGAALHAAATLPALREAVAWQNRHALATGLDALVRRGPEPARRDSKHRQHEALVASYLQRYCTKNDTIGFFGPVSWTAIDGGAGIRVNPAETLLGKRITYLEGWAVCAVLAADTAALRPWLVPRRMPFIGVDGDVLRPPLAPPVPLTPAEAAVLHACDGVRDARAVAAEVHARTGLAAAEVFAVLERLADRHRLAWRIDVPPQDIRPERAMRTLLARVTEPEVRARAEAALDRLTTARDGLASVAGDPDRVASAMAELEATFTRLTGERPTRRAGALYAGRTLAYEECLRAGTVHLGMDAFDGIRAALGLVLDSARWFTATCAELYAKRFTELYRRRAAELGSDVVPFADFWLLANDDLFERPPALIRPALGELAERWAAIVGPRGGTRRLQLRAGDLRSVVASAFPARRRPWPMAVHHSPDLMVGRSTWVLGELHPSVVTMRYASWLAFHPDPDTLRAGLRHDLGRGAVFLAETAEEDGVAARLANALSSAGDRRLVFGHDSCGYDGALPVGECDLVDSPAGLRVRRRDGGFEAGLLEVVGDLLAAGFSNSFRLLPRDAHTPRVTVDDLVIARESWTFAAAGLTFAGLADERDRYLRARAWVRSHGLPRHVFLRFTGERKPIYADLTGLASIDLISRAIRRANRMAGATVTVVEMLPTPEEAWLTDAEGRRYTAELRLVAADQNRDT